MLIYLSKSLFDVGFSKEHQKRINRALENILRSNWEGKHLVHANFDTLNKLREQKLSNDSKSVILNICNNYSLLDYSKIKHFVYVVPEENTLELKIENDIEKYCISVDYFQNSDLLQESRILCEHLNDAKLFQLICNYFVKKENIGNIALRFEPELGGGATICDCFEKHVINRNKFCLAFSDNDKRYPNALIGGTLEKLNAVDINGNIFCKIIEIDSHEIENLVPFNYLNDIRTIHHQQKGINFIESIRNSSSCELLKYFDIKKGICKKQINNCPEYLSYAEQLIPFCETIENISEIEDKAEGFSVIPPIGKIVKDFIEKSDLLNSKEPEFLSFQELEWDKIGSNFLYWACSRNLEALNI
ncbi:MAG: hypothetical protein JEY96_16720 [Bacteroidales bacterium]|nr:hypothetical protein [Bacteroidales bacterium]